MSAFKTYVIKERHGNAVFEREVQIALKEELEIEREGTPPDPSKVITTKDLITALNKNEPLARIFKARAAEVGAQVFPKPKKGFVQKLKGMLS